MAAMTVAEVMTRSLITVGLDEPLATVLAWFRQNHCHHVLVVEQGRLVGVISDRDVLRHVSPFVGTLAELARDEATLELPAHCVMTRKPLTAASTDDIEEAALRLLAAGISCLPVVREGGQLVGIVSWRDLLRALAGAPSLPAGL